MPKSAPYYPGGRSGISPTDDYIPHSPPEQACTLLIMIPEKNSSFIQSYPNIGFGSICFYIKSGPGHSHFHPLQIHLKGTVFISGNIKIPFSPKLHRTIEQSKLLGIPQTGIRVQVYNTAILQNYPHLFTIRNTYFSIFRFRENPRPVSPKHNKETLKEQMVTIQPPPTSTYGRPISFHAHVLSHS